jgi:hypothetical protein
MRDNKDQLLGTLDLLVLRTLSTGGTMHGYAIWDLSDNNRRARFRFSRRIGNLKGRGDP